MVAMPILVTATLDSTTGQSADRVSNSFVFMGHNDAPSNAALDVALGAVINFYRDGIPAGESIAAHLSPTISRAANGGVVKAYDITGKLQNRGPLLVRGKMREQGPPPHGSPIRQALFTVGAGGGTVGLPDEVAAVLTLRGVGWAGQPVEAPDGTDEGDAIDRPRQRYTGRIYLGPLSTSASTMTNGVPRLAQTLREALLFRAAALNTQVEAGGWMWGVWSRARGAVASITDVQVDDEFDTQRRRGKKASLRTTQSGF